MKSILKLVHHRWSLPVIAELHRRGGGARFAELLHAVGASRESLRQTLASLADSHLTAPNPGYGHPLRPEYVLTDRGLKIAPACAALVAAVRREDVEAVVLKKWSIPVLLALSPERRFAELREELGASPRALALALKDLAEAGLVERRIHDSFPPASSYRLTSRARTLRRAAARIAV